MQCGKGFRCKGRNTLLLDSGEDVYDLNGK